MINWASLQITPIDRKVLTFDNLNKDKFESINKYKVEVGFSADIIILPDIQIKFLSSCLVRWECEQDHLKSLF